MGSEGSVEQRYGPMNKNRMMRPTVPGELASDSEAHIHQGRCVGVFESLRSSMPLSTWLDHESLATTQKYLEPSKETEKQLEEMKLPF